MSISIGGKTYELGEIGPADFLDCVKYVRRLAAYEFMEDFRLRPIGAEDRQGVLARIYAHNYDEHDLTGNFECRAFLVHRSVCKGNNQEKLSLEQIRSGVRGSELGDAFYLLLQISGYMSPPEPDSDGGDETDPTITSTKSEAELTFGALSSEEMPG